MSSFPSLTLLILLPMIGGFLLLCFPGLRISILRRIALGVAGLEVLLFSFVWKGFDLSAAGLQWIERHEWIPAIGVEYSLGLDGLGLLCVALTVLLTPVAIWLSRESDAAVVGEHGEAEGGRRLGCYLLLQAGLVGTFTAFNFIHWFLFWELALIPAFFLVRWGSGSGRARAAFTFLLYTLVGSLTMLLAFVGLYMATGTFDFVRLQELADTGELQSALSARSGWFHLAPSALVDVLFVGVLLAFAVKVPLFPFHGWLGATYRESYPSTTLLLSGVMSKMGLYGLLRIVVPIFPDSLERWSPVLAVLAVITIVYGAWLAAGQKSWRSILAYSSMNHLGYCWLILALAAPGLAKGNFGFAEVHGLNGFVFQLVSHGFITAALFVCISLLEQRREAGPAGGLRSRTPFLCALMGMLLFAALGLPGFAGFPGEFLMFQGVFALSPGMGLLALVGVFVTGIFLVQLFQNIFNGSPRLHWPVQLTDLSKMERCVLMAMVLVVLMLGLRPQIVLEFSHPIVQNLLSPVLF